MNIEAASVGAFQFSDSGDDGPFEKGEYMTERGLEGEVLELDGVRVLIFGRDSFWRREECVAAECGANDVDDIEAGAKVL